MTFFQVSIIGNVILGIIVALFALDRASFRRICELRHNPIDEAVKEIKRDIGMIKTRLSETVTKEDLTRIWEAIERLRGKR